MKKVLGIISSILNALVSSLPYPWWYTNIGGLLKAYTSPFSVELKFLEVDYSTTILLPINLLLLGLRSYIIVYNLINIYLIFKNQNKISLFIFWVSIFYLIDPIIILIISLILFNQPILILGKYEFNYSYNGYEVSILMENYPLFTYYLALIAGILSIIYKIISRSK